MIIRIVNRRKIVKEKESIIIVKIEIYIYIRGSFKYTLNKNSS